MMRRTTTVLALLALAAGAGRAEDAAPDPAAALWRRAEVLEMKARLTELSAKRAALTAVTEQYEVELARARVVNDERAVAFLTTRLDKAQESRAQLASAIAALERGLANHPPRAERKVLLDRRARLRAMASEVEREIAVWEDHLEHAVAGRDEAAARVARDRLEVLRVQRGKAKASLAEVNGSLAATGGDADDRSRTADRTARRDESVLTEEVRRLREEVADLRAVVEELRRRLDARTAAESGSGR